MKINLGCPLMRVVYLISGPAHLPYLVVSVKHLRTVWQGEVCVYTWAESQAIVRQISQDKRLDITYIPRTPSYRGKNAQFFDKIKLMQGFNDGPNLYLDADTMPVQEITDLFTLAKLHGFCATQFCNWVSNTGHAKNRVQRLRDYAVPQEYVEESLSFPFPSVNGGVFCCMPDSPVLKTWEKWTDICKETLFIADETVLHAVARKYNPNQMAIESGLYNCSPKKKWWNHTPAEVKIWHFHGDSNVRPNKSQYGFDLWWPEYVEAINENLGGIQDWKDNVGNKYISNLESEGKIKMS